MGILGIENRTENWKTTEVFRPFFTDGEARVRLLEGIVGKELNLSADDVKIELFWKPIRDWKAHKERTCPQSKNCLDEKIETACKKQLECLDVRSKLSSCIKKRRLTDKRVKCLTDIAYKDKKKATSNLIGTEIDIVLEADGYLCIGEAKEESKFGSNRKLALVHQLIRQYITATVLLALTHNCHKIVPFVVLSEEDQTKFREEESRPFQLDFLIKQGWMKRCNIRSWCEIQKE